MRAITIALKATALALPLSFAATAAQAQDIAQVLQEDPRFQTFHQALEAADMVETLRGAGPFTVFAPTEGAFEALPEDTLDTLLAEENREALGTLLRYHIVEGEAVTSADLRETETLEAEVGTIHITRVNEQPMLARAEALLEPAEPEAAPEAVEEVPPAEEAPAIAEPGVAPAIAELVADPEEQITAMFGEEPEGVRIGDPDIAADNGIIHAIEHVLVPAAVTAELRQQ